MNNRVWLISAVTVIGLAGIIFSSTMRVDSGLNVFSSDPNPLPDFAVYTDVKGKKQAFFSYLQPMIEANNRRLLKQRQRLLAIDGKTLDDLSRSDKTFIQELVEHYEITGDLAEQQQLEALILRLDSVPTSLALAQAAMESAWGTSRFAREGNNLFGQWCYKEGCGIVPARRGAGQTHEVARFANVDAAIASYLRNINSHNAYAELRAARAALRKLEQPVTGHAMAGHLLRYSERGSAYVEEIRSMIRVNKLAALDSPASSPAS